MSKRYEHKLRIYESEEEYGNYFIKDLNKAEEKGYSIATIFSHNGFIEVWFKRESEEANSNDPMVSKEN